MEKKKKRESLKLVKIKDAINLVNQEINLLGIVLERREPKQCRNNDWICTLKIIDDSYQSPGLTVNVFSNKLEELPYIKNHHDMILFIRIKMKSFDGGKGVNAACDKRVSSFALYEGRTGEDFVCYQCTSNFREEGQYKSSIDELGKLFASSSRVDEALQSSSYRTKAHTLEKFSFLREIKEGKRFDLVCKILHVNEDMSTIFVWDGTDAPPASLRNNETEDKAFSSLSIHTLLSREILLGFPTVGTILRISSLSSHQFHGVKPGEWVKLYRLLCEVDKGSWIGKATDSTLVRLAQDDRLVEKIMRIYDKRISSKSGHIPFWSFPSPPGLTETDDDRASFVTLMDIITFPKVTYKYRCIVRVLAAYPSDENGRYRVLLTLEDPTATLEAFLCDKDAEYFWGLEYQNTEMLRKKLNRLMGIKESSMSMAPRNPPWIECCVISTHETEHKAAGQSWEDPTVSDGQKVSIVLLVCGLYHSFSEIGFWMVFALLLKRMFCGDLGNEVDDDVLSKAFARFPTTFNMAKGPDFVHRVRFNAFIGKESFIHDVCGSRKPNVCFWQAQDDGIYALDNPTGALKLMYKWDNKH